MLRAHIHLYLHMCSICMPTHRWEFGVVGSNRQIVVCRLCVRMRCLVVEAIFASSDRACHPLFPFCAGASTVSLVRAQCVLVSPLISKELLRYLVSPMSSSKWFLVSSAVDNESHEAQ